MKYKQGSDIATFIEGCDIAKGRYIIFENGEIHDLVKGTVKNQNDNGGGYKTVGFFCRTDRYTKIRYVHRLVLEAFKGREEGRNYVNHKDGNKENNHLNNLEWVTAKENTRHGIELGTINGSSRIGNKLNRLPYESIENSIKLLCKGLSLREIADEVGSKRGTITTLMNGRSRVEEVRKALDSHMCGRSECRCSTYSSRVVV